ncbi:MAG TPA: CBS domain-containing protein [Pyrinomonadaceae bacterium]
MPSCIFTMGQHDIELEVNEHCQQMFMKALLDDLRALEYMLDNSLIAPDVQRVGAEQEMFLVDSNMRPAPVAMEILAHAQDPRLTTEIALFNLEANLTPVELNGRCFSQMEAELRDVIESAKKSAKKFQSEVLLTGILPTLQKGDLTLDNMTPNPRYAQLNDSVSRIRRGPFNIHIKGLDEIQLTHDNIMMESCTASFQVHLQVNPADFVETYNMAQVVAAPVLAAAVNSPMLLGRRLWQETRLALFQHSADARSQAQQARSDPTRVFFGERWLNKSVLELFYEQVARFRVIMTSPSQENPLSVLSRGEIPTLGALCLHNGTVWRWNRACYGVRNGVAHLRIENRALPSGPTIIDEIANAVFFAGLMVGMPGEYGDITRLMSFDDAKDNFFIAARHGLNSQFSWIDGENVGAADLILKQLLPLARRGLKEQQVSEADIDRYLGVIESRVASRQTGAQWMLRSFSSMSHKPRESRTRALTEEMLCRQQSGKPVSTWSLMGKEVTMNWPRDYQTVGQFMTTDLFTARPDDLVDLAASLMDWRHIRHVPVENEEGRLVGLVSHRALLRLLVKGPVTDALKLVKVGEIMRTDVVTVSSNTPTLDAMEIMRRGRFGCLPVVDDGHLVGIVTSYDFLDASAQIFRQQLEAKNRAASA